MQPPFILVYPFSTQYHLWKAKIIHAGSSYRMNLAPFELLHLVQTDIRAQSLVTSPGTALKESSVWAKSPCVIFPYCLSFVPIRIWTCLGSMSTLRGICYSSRWTAWFWRLLVVISAKCSPFSTQCCPNYPRRFGWAYYDHTLTGSQPELCSRPPLNNSYSRVRIEAAMQLIRAGGTVIEYQRRTNYVRLAL